jgi:hypothetical protein
MKEYLVPQKKLLKKFQGMGKPPPTRELCCENDSDNDNDDNNVTVSDEHVTPPPNHEALHCNQPQPFIVQS